MFFTVSKYFTLVPINKLYIIINESLNLFNTAFSTYSAYNQFSSEYS